MTKKEKQKRTIMGILSSLMHHFSDKELNNFMGSLTIEEMHELYNELKYEDYCKQHGLKSYKEMDELDYEQWYWEEYNISIHDLVGDD